MSQIQCTYGKCQRAMEANYFLNGGEVKSFLFQTSKKQRLREVPMMYVHKVN